MEMEREVMEKRKRIDKLRSLGQQIIDAKIEEMRTGGTIIVHLYLRE